MVFGCMDGGDVVARVLWRGGENGGLVVVGGHVVARVLW